MNSQQMRSPIQDLNKIKSVEFLAWVKEGLLRSHPYLRIYWQLIDAGKERVTFQDCDQETIAHLPVHGSTLMYMHQH